MSAPENLRNPARNATLIPPLSRLHFVGEPRFSSTRDASKSESSAFSQKCTNDFLDVEADAGGFQQPNKKNRSPKMPPHDRKVPKNRVSSPKLKYRSRAGAD